MEHVVRWANSRQISLGTAVASRARPRRNALLAELAFVAAGRGYQPFVRNALDQWEVQRVQAFIATLPGGWPAHDDVSALEWSEVDRLTRVLARFIGGLSQPRFSPIV